MQIIFFFILICVQTYEMDERDFLTNYHLLVFIYFFIFIFIHVSGDPCKKQKKEKQNKTIVVQQMKNPFQSFAWRYVKYHLPY